MSQASASRPAANVDLTTLIKTLGPLLSKFKPWEVATSKRAWAVGATNTIAVKQLESWPEAATIIGATVAYVASDTVVKVVTMYLDKRFPQAVAPQSVTPEKQQ